MAAKKKVVSKKIATRKVIEKVNKGRKARGAKPIPAVRAQSTNKAFKRPYNRKPKDPRGGHVDAPLPTAVNVLAETNGVLEEGNMAFRGDQSNEIPTGSLLQVIEGLDMRGLAIDDRFAMLASLRHEGYLTSTGKDLFGTSEDLVIGLSSELLVLNHNNKLVSACDWNSLDVRLNRVSRPVIHVHATIGFTYPERINPDIVEIDGVPYQPVF